MRCLWALALGARHAPRAQDVARPEAVSTAERRLVASSGQQDWGVRQVEDDEDAEPAPAAPERLAPFERSFRAPTYAAWAQKVQTAHAASAATKRRKRPPSPLRAPPEEALVALEREEAGALAQGPVYGVQNFEDRALEMEMSKHPQDHHRSVSAAETEQRLNEMDSWLLQKWREGISGTTQRVLSGGVFGSVHVATLKNDPQFWVASKIQAAGCPVPNAKTLEKLQVCMHQWGASLESEVLAMLLFHDSPYVIELFDVGYGPDFQRRPACCKGAQLLPDGTPGASLQPPTGAGAEPALYPTAMEFSMLMLAANRDVKDMMCEEHDQGLFSKCKHKLDQMMRLPSAMRLWYILELLEGVAALHARGIVHRDLKTANVLVHCDLEAGHQTSEHVVAEEDLDEVRNVRKLGNKNLQPGRGQFSPEVCTLKIADMGFACTMAPTKDPADVHSRIEACHLEFMGTPIYQPPEAGGSPGRATSKKHRDGPERDVFAAGLVAHVLLFGQLPAKHRHIMVCRGPTCESQLLHLQQHWDHTADVDSLPEGDEMQDVALRLLQGLLHKDPQQRLSAPQALALVRELAPELHQRHVAKNAATRNERVARLPADAKIPQLTVETLIAADLEVLRAFEAAEYQRKMILVGVGCGILALVLAAAAYFYWRDRKQKQEEL